MIAAVVDARGEGAARTTFEKLGGEWKTWTRGHAVVGRRADAPREDACFESTSLDLAHDQARSGALVGLDGDDAVVLARGAFGGRSLYYAPLAHGGFIACSRLAPLLEASGRAFSIDADRIASYVGGLVHPETTGTCFAGVRRVAPCSAARLSADGKCVVVDRPAPERAPLEAPAEEIAEQLWQRFRASVERAIGDARSVAVMVGGGVDSSGLLAAAVAIARGASAREVNALALDFDSESTDRPYLRDLVRDLDLVPVRLAPRDASPWFRSSLVMDAQPYLLPIGPMEQLVFRRARELGAEVLLSGYMADGLLAGDMRGLARGPIVESLRLAMSLRLPWPSTPRERVMDYIVKPRLKPLVPMSLRKRHSARQLVSYYPWARPRLRRVLDEALEHQAEMMPPKTPRDRFEDLAQNALLADHADWRTQIESETNLVRKDPYADDGVVDIVARAPTAALVHGGFYRGLFREALRGRVPESIRLRADKAAFEPAFAEAAGGAEGLRSLGGLWDLRRLADLDIVEPAIFRSTMEPLLRDPAATTSCAHLWTFAVQALACEAFCAWRDESAKP
jgi:asparagine synthase (glutamine-hydrolysing)